jgi:hypothetical protein
VKARHPCHTSFRVLLELGRRELAALLDGLRDELAARNISAPEPGLPDQTYFGRVSQVLRLLHLRAWLPSQPTATESPQDPSSRTAQPLITPAPRYAIRKGLGVWKLVFDGQETELRHERGIFYVAYLLTNPPQHPIHALDLIAKIPEMYRDQLGLEQIADPATGKAAPLQSHARIQERSLALDDAQALRALLRKEKELEAILDDDNESEPVKAEALRELEAIAEFQRKHGRRAQNNAQRAADSVRKAITRFHRRLLKAATARSNSGPVLAQFAAHLEKHLLVPSRRYSGHGNARARTGLAGSFTYEPPPAIAWST